MKRTLTFWFALLSVLIFSACEPEYERAANLPDIEIINNYLLIGYRLIDMNDITKVSTIRLDKKTVRVCIYTDDDSDSIYSYQGYVSASSHVISRVVKILMKNNIDFQMEYYEPDKK